MTDADMQTVCIDVTMIPTFRKEELARGALLLVEQVFSLPGAEERYQAWRSERKRKEEKHDDC